MDTKKNNCITSVDSFWDRQFSATTSSSQLVFDCLFVVVLPLLFLFRDDLVLRRIMHGMPTDYLPTQRLLWQLVIVAGGMAFCVSMLIRRVGALAKLIAAGMLYASALAAIGFGLELLPLLFTVVGSGLLPAILFGPAYIFPFATAFSLSRHAWKWHKAGQPTAGHQAVFIGMGAVAFFVVVVTPFAVVESRMADSVEALRSSDFQKHKQAMDTVLALRSFTDSDRLYFEWMKEDNEPVKRRLAEAYLQLTGLTVQQRLGQLLD